MKLFPYIKTASRFIVDFFKNHPVPIGLTYMWNFGAYTFICILLQFVSGFLMNAYYAPEMNDIWTSLDIMLREMPYAYIIRYLHANVASMLFFVMYIHILRGIYYGSYLPPRTEVWIVGVILLILMIATAFLGYVLPWGQMSRWAAQVVIQIFTAIPKLGEELVYWFWGGYSLNFVSLRRIYILHVMTPAVAAALSLLHTTLLHDVGSNDPSGTSGSMVDSAIMFPFFIYKDSNGLLGFLLIFTIFVYIIPTKLGHWDNFVKADPAVTPAHIVPEWYFLWIYAILRSIPHKLLGVCILGLALFALFFMPYWIPEPIRSLDNRRYARVLFWIWVANVICLALIGALPPNTIAIWLGRIGTILYFILLFTLRYSIAETIWPHFFKIKKI